MKIITTLILTVLLIFSSCAPARFVKPLDKGEVAVGVNLGGPLVNFSGMVIPIPYTSLYAGFGWKDKTTVYTGLHLTALAFSNLQLDVGASHEFGKQSGIKPSISGGGSLVIIANDRDFRIYPTFDANAFWEYADNKWMTYAGSSVWLDFFKGEAVNQETAVFLVPEFHVGQTYRFTSVELTIEYKFMSPFVKGDMTVAEYANFTDYGASGIYFSIMKRF
ncbi:MAG: hypothetical protein KAH48_11115 [Chlorobi bacterium]|nr:hypothetical protein [Chlorobiota bacterium]